MLHPRVREAVLTSKHGGQVTVYYNGKVKTLRMKAGKRKKLH